MAIADSGDCRVVVAPRGRDPTVRPRGAGPVVGWLPAPASLSAIPGAISKEPMANKKTKRRSNWSPPRTSGTGSGPTREAAANRGPREPAPERPASATAGRQVQAPSTRRPAETPSANRQARKEEARRQREALRRRAARRRTARLAGIVAGAIAVVVAIVLVVTLGHHKSTTSTKEKTLPNPGTLTGILRTAPPWPANNDPAALKSRLSAIGLHALGAEGTVEHIHMHLDILVDGNAVTVPAQIGIASDGSFLAELHTHDTSGIVHFESPTQTSFTLGQFFDDWGVYFTKSCIGSLCNAGDKTLQVFVNGKPLSGDPTKLAFSEHQEIVVAYGTQKELPSPIPSTYPSTGP